MSTPFTSLTIQGIADSLGIKLSNQELINYIDRDCDFFLRQIISQANAFCNTTRSYKLSPVHIDMVLESQGLPPLLGYDLIPSYSTTILSVDQADIFAVKENMQILQSVINEPITPLSNDIIHQLQWTLVEGSYIGKRSSTSSRDKSSKQSRDSKSIERSVSVPNVSSIPHSESARSQNSNANGNQFYGSSEVYEKSNNNPNDSKKCADDILSTKHQNYFIKTIILLRSDNANSLDVTLSMISEEDKMQPLLPYFLQYITGKMTLEFNNVKSMKVLIRFTLSLLQNKSMNIPLYAHPFLRIIISTLLSSNVSSADPNSSYIIWDTDIRQYAADALFTLVQRCENCFTEMKEVIFNTLQETLFNPDATLFAHYGAILGIKAIGFIGKILPHFRSYLKSIKYELNSNFNFQAQIVESVLDLSKSSLFEFAETASDQDEKDLALQIINDIDAITY